MRSKAARRGAAAAAVAVLLALAGCSAEPLVEVDVPAQVDGRLPEETTAQLQDAVTHAMAAAGASGAVVGVWAPWSGTWVTGLGTQRAGGSAPVAADMEFRAGTITRAMTCDALYLLADQGTVALDDSIAEYVSGIADTADVTLEQLCDSTSGIGGYSGRLLPSWLAVPDRVWDPRELASYGLGQTRTTAPGDAYRDSDAGYVLLGLALERATGRSASEILQEEVFDPLLLAHTSLPTNPSARIPDLLPGFHGARDAEGVMNCTEPTDVTRMSSSFGYTNSGIVTDIDDLGRYVQALASSSLTPDADRFENPLPMYPDAPSWYTTTGGAVQAGSLVGQSGFVPGYASAAYADSKSGLTVAVVLNNSASGSGIANALAWELAAIASKAPAIVGETLPDAGLPWTAQQYHDAITAAAICPLPAAE